MSLVSAIKSGRILAIDPATHSYAFAIVEYDKLIAYGKIAFPKNATQSEKFAVIASTLPTIIDSYNPKKVVIEQTILIQNPKTTRLLAYMVGYLWGKAAESNIEVKDVVPLTWKPGIGYKNISKAEKAAWLAELGKKEADKKADFERKERVKRIIDVKLPGHNCTDPDILDAIGIGLWAIQNA